uniref:Uncharacterized protein n=1 Tax=viral metagenome TaxID=1070528 RepID=A0A6C0BET4_9ZZZZ
MSSCSKEINFIQNGDGTFELFGILFVYNQLEKKFVKYADGIEHSIPNHFIELPNRSYWSGGNLYIYVPEVNCYIDARGDKYISIVCKKIMNILFGIFVEKEMLLILIRLFIEPYVNYFECYPIYYDNSMNLCRYIELPSELKYYFTGYSRPEQMRIIERPCVFDHSFYAMDMDSIQHDTRLLKIFGLGIYIPNDEKSTPVKKKLCEQKQKKTKWPINNPKTINYLLQSRIFQPRKKN